MIDFAALGFDALKVLGGVGVTAVSYYTILGMRPPKEPNGRGVQRCEDLIILNKVTTENNTLLKEISKENRLQHKSLFDKVDTLEEGMAVIRTKQSFTNGKLKKKTAKQLTPFTCLVIDDHQDTAESTARLLETYLKGIIYCTPVTSVEEAREKLSEQEFDFTLIDYYLNSSENGYDAYKYFKEAYPNMKCLIYSGQSPESINPEIKDIYIEKPFKRDIVIEKITKLLDG